MESLDDNPRLLRFKSVFLGSRARRHPQFLRRYVERQLPMEPRLPCTPADLPYYSGACCSLMPMIGLQPFRKSMHLTTLQLHNSLRNHVYSIIWYIYIYGLYIISSTPDVKYIYTNVSDVKGRTYVVCMRIGHQLRFRRRPSWNIP